MLSVLVIISAHLSVPETPVWAQVIIQVLLFAVIYFVPNTVGFDNLIIIYFCIYHTIYYLLWFWILLYGSSDGEKQRSQRNNEVKEHMRYFLGTMKADC